MHKIQATGMFAIILGSLLLSSCGSSSPEVTTPTSEPQEQVLEVAVYTPASEKNTPTHQATGTISASTEVQVPAVEQGTVQSLLVEVGSQVQAGDPIAMVGTGNSSNSLLIQMTNLSTSITNLRQSIQLNSVALDKNIELARLGIENAKLSENRAQQQLTLVQQNNAQELANAMQAVENARTQIGLSTGVAETSVSQAETALNSARANADAAYSDVRANARISYNQLMAYIDNILTASNGLIGAEWPKKSASTQFEYLGILDRQLQNDTRTAFDRAKSSYDNLKQKEAAAASLEANLAQLHTVAANTKTLVELLDKLPDRSITTNQFSQADIDRAASIINSFESGQNNIYNLESQITQIEQSIVNSDRQGQQAVAQAEIALETAKKNLASTEQTGNSDTSIAVKNAESTLASTRLRIQTEETNAKQTLASATLQVKQTEEQLAQAQANKQSQLQSLQTQLADLEGQRALLTERNSNLTVTAPISGVVTETLVSQGASVNNGTPLVTIIDPSEKKLIVQLTQAQAEQLDITKFKLGDQFLSLSGGSPVVDEADRMRSFEYSMPSTDKTPAGSLVSGELLYIVPSNVVLLPLQYTYIDTNEVYVYVARGNTAQKVVLTKYTLRDEYILIEEGLTANDQIISTKSPYLEEGVTITITGSNAAQQ